MLRRWRTLPAPLLVTLAAVVLAVSAPIAWYLGSPLFVNQVVDEEFPVGVGAGATAPALAVITPTAAAPPTPPASPTPPAPTATAARASATSAPVVAPTATMPPPTPTAVLATSVVAASTPVPAAQPATPAQSPAPAPPLPTSRVASAAQPTRAAVEPSAPKPAPASRPPTPEPAPATAPPPAPTATPPPAPTATVAPAPPTATPAPAGPVALRSGAFTRIDAVHWAEGKATIYRLPDGQRLLRLEPFRAGNGPGLYVYLSGHPAPRSNDQFRAAGAVEIAPLKGNIGNQNYVLPPDLDLAAFKSVVIYCKPFSVVFSTAELSPAVG